MHPRIRTKSELSELVNETFFPRKGEGGAYCGEVAYLSAPGLLEIEKGA